MYIHDTIEKLAEIVGIDYDPKRCDTAIRDDYLNYEECAINDTSNGTYVEFSHSRDTGQTLAQGVLSIISKEDIGLHPLDTDDRKFIPASPDADRDLSFHGLFKEGKGKILFQSPHSEYLFYTVAYKEINGPEGANAVAQKLGKTPGVDAPIIFAKPNTTGESTAGEITENFADMRMQTPSVHGFYLAQHDLGYKTGAHGPSWPSTHPAIYTHIAQHAQLAIEEFGDRIHADKKDRPKIAEHVANALDSLIGHLREPLILLTTMELRIRDGRYTHMSDNDLFESLMSRAFKICSKGCSEIATDIRFMSPKTASEKDRYQKGYWTGMQLLEGLVDTRIVLHEVQPHPEADPAHTTRALDVLNAMKKDITRRFTHNKEHIL